MKKTYIYGAGNFGRIVGRYLKSIGEDFQYVDKFCKYNEVDGVRVVRPSDICGRVGNSRALNTVCAMPVRADVQSNLLTEISAIGFEKVIDFPDVGHMVPHAFLALASDKQFWRTYGDDAFPLWNDGACKKVREWLCDERSKALFDNIKDFRHDPCLRNYIWPDVGVQYIDVSLDSFPSCGEMNVLDLGAYTGDSLDDFIKTYGARIVSYNAVEPDPKNYALLEQNAAMICGKYTTSSELDIKLYRNATGAKEEELRFSSLGDSTSCFSAEGSYDVTSITLDQHFRGAGINYIKFDIEGAELATIQGGMQLIKEQQPDMAVSLYHRPEDLWVLPTIIKELMPESNMYVRQHHHWGLELTLYVKGRV